MKGKTAQTLFRRVDWDADMNLIDADVTCIVVSLDQAALTTVTPQLQESMWTGGRRLVTYDVHLEDGPKT